MLDFSQMLIRLVIALVAGGILGVERELAGKEAGTRTSMMVAGGSALFAVIALSIPYILSQETGASVQLIATSNSGFLTIMGNIVVGVGFLGAGIVIKTEEHVHGLTTAAVIWTVAAIGLLAGVGLFEVAIASSCIIALTLYFMRILNISEQVQKHGIKRHRS